MIETFYPIKINFKKINCKFIYGNEIQNILSLVHLREGKKESRINKYNSLNLPSNINYTLIIH